MLTPLRVIQFFLAAILIAFSLQADAQRPVKQWDRTIGGYGPELFSCLQQTADGGYILGGFSASAPGGDKTAPSNGVNDYWLVKLDANGNKQWDRTIGSNGDDVLTSLQQTTDGGYILGGYATQGASASGYDMTGRVRGFYDYWIVKLDANGVKQWDHTLGSGPFTVNWLMSVKQTADGGFIAGGQSDGGALNDKSEPSRGVRDYWIIKFTSTGVKQWDRTYGANGREELEVVRQTADGGYLLAGTTESPASGEKSQPTLGVTDFWVVKVDANGLMQWERTYGGNALDVLKSALQTADGGYLLGGYSRSGVGGDKSEPSRGDTDYWVVKVDAAGVKQWDHTYGGSSTERLATMQQTVDGGYVFGGSSASNISGEKSQRFYGSAPSKLDYWLVKANNLGILTWDLTVGGNGTDSLIDLKQTSDGGFILGGGSESPISGDVSEALAGFEDWWIIKLAPVALSSSQTVALKPTLQVYPNPAHGSVRILHRVNQILTLTDMLGREIRTWSGNQETLYMDGIQSGMYILHQGQSAVKLVIN